MWLGLFFIFYFLWGPGGKDGEMVGWVMTFMFYDFMVTDYCVTA